MNSSVRMAESDGEVQEETLTFEFVSMLDYFYFRSCIMPNYRARKEHRALKKLLQMVPCLPECLMESSNEESMMVADLVRLVEPLGAASRSLSMPSWHPNNRANHCQRRHRR